LGVGVLVAVAAVALAVVSAFPPETMGGGTRLIPIGPLALPESLVVSAVAGATALVGLAWMLRIFRGERRDPPAWRYRDR
jgi:hypothetical protein